MSDADRYIAAIVGFINSITFDGTTLGDPTKKLIAIYNRSEQDQPLTQVNVYAGPISTAFLENKLNKETQPIVIQVRSMVVTPKVPTRNLQAQQDVNYLVEQITRTVSQQMSNSVWQPGYLNNDSIITTPPNYNDNYYTREVTVNIHKFVQMNN